jgi:threonine dehydratase
MRVREAYLCLHFTRGVEPEGGSPLSHTCVEADTCSQISLASIERASEALRGVAGNTPLSQSVRLSERYGARIFFKREDLQEVRSYKIRGAYNLMSALSEAERHQGVVCASAGNHAQGVALSAALLKINATIFMPETTPLQKIERVRHFGREWITIKLIGRDFDAANERAGTYCDRHGSVFVHPFDDYSVIAGQGTVAREIFADLGRDLDFVICPIGGGGLIAGVASYLKSTAKYVRVIGVEPSGAAAMYESLQADRLVSLDRLDSIAEGASVRRVGDKTFPLVRKLVDEIVLVTDGEICSAMIDLYQNDGIVAEPAGVLSVCGLDAVADQIGGKTVACILSGGNNDLLRYPEIMERSLVHRGLKHYFLIEFAQRPGELRKFVANALGESDDIVRFEYIKKTSKEMGPALVGVELAEKNDLPVLLGRMEALGIRYVAIHADDPLYSHLI